MSWKSDQNIHVFYDDQCELCQRFKTSVEYICPKKFFFHPLHSAQTQEEFPGIDQDDLKEKLHVLSQEGVWLQEGEAVHYLATHCPSVEKFRWLLESDAGKKASQYFYKMTDQLRRSLRKHCRTC